MRYAFISDIHANLPALDAVLRDIGTRAVDAVYHLGDLVGYAPWPNEVVERIRADAIPGVAETTTRLLRRTTSTADASMKIQNKKSCRMSRMAGRERTCPRRQSAF